MSAGLDLHTVQFSSPSIIGTYNFDFDIANTDIRDNSYVTAFLTWNAPLSFDFYSTTIVWTQVHSPTVVYGETTSTSTYLVQTTSGMLFYSLPYLTLMTMLETTSTVIYTTTTTVTPIATDVTGAPSTPTITNTITNTPFPDTTYQCSTIFQTTLACLTLEPYRKLRARQAAVYSPPYCGGITTTTVATATTTVTVPSTSTVVNINYQTVMSTYTVTATGQAQDNTFTTTVNLMRRTITKTSILTITDIIFPWNTVCGGFPLPPTTLVKYSAPV